MRWPSALQTQFGLGAYATPAADCASRRDNKRGHAAVAYSFPKSILWARATNTLHYHPYLEGERLDLVDPKMSDLATPRGWRQAQSLSYAHLDMLVGLIRDR